MKKTAALVLAATSIIPASGVVVMLSDTEAAGAELESYLKGAFNNVTEIRHGNYANFSATSSQDALNGTGAFAGGGPAEVFIIGRTLSSGAYDNGDADGYNTLPIPVIALTSYVARNTTNRLGWHASGATAGTSTAGAETNVAFAGSLVFGTLAGSYDYFNSAGGTFNGLAGGTTAFGGGFPLATIGGDTLAAYWQTGAAPGDPTAAGVATFPGDRLLFNLDNDTAGSDIASLSQPGREALRQAIDFASPLTVPEPSSALLGLLSLGLLARRRR